jgi:hypothetical protein
MPVADFESKHFWRTFERRLELVDTSLPFAEVKRYTGGAANESAVDSIDLGNARERVMALFLKYGFDEEPRTWAELRGNHRYIVDLQTAIDSVAIGYRDNVPAGLAFIQSFRPALYDAVRACIVHGYAGLQAYHRENVTFRLNAAAYDESSELPTKELDDTPWPEHLQ